jgi:hypothetical protein
MRSISLTRGMIFPVYHNHEEGVLPNTNVWHGVCHFRFAWVPVNRDQKEGHRTFSRCSVLKDPNCEHAIDPRMLTSLGWRPLSRWMKIEILCTVCQQKHYTFVRYEKFTLEIISLPPRPVRFGWLTGTRRREGSSTCQREYPLSLFPELARPPLPLWVSPWTHKRGRSTGGSSHPQTLPVPSSIGLIILVPCEREGRRCANSQGPTSQSTTAGLDPCAKVRTRVENIAGRILMVVKGGAVLVLVSTRYGC